MRPSVLRLSAVRFCHTLVSVSVKPAPASLVARSSFATSSRSPGRMESRASLQQSWTPPKPSSSEPKLQVYNSLTRTKVDFVTKKPGIVTWYNCGPTVYDASHMGHARNYMAQDIMRRILRDYFGYEVHFVMNITDVDDKIILRARHQHLLSKYITEKTSLSVELLADVRTAWSAYVVKNLSGALKTPQADAKLAWNEIQESAKDTEWVDEQKVREEKFAMYLAAARAGLEGIESSENALQSGQTGPEQARQLIESNTDAVSVWLDKQFGSDVNDPAIFRNLAAYWEDSYFQSMSALHVERPDVLTRVSEYIPEIVSFVEGIVDRGFAYEANGSVWFDTVKFEGALGEDTPGEDGWKHTYAKLQPWSKGNRELLEDGEGSLTSSNGKRSSADFALWKASKPGEPAWPSTWGPGRPGWHIECSVMASAVLGEGMDVHSGGVDLAFPHHDNEIAQSEAFHNCRQWVNYFLHTGHLHIEGLKMSKSLKNFITIDDALERYSARQLRFAFLLQAWNAKLDFKDSLMQEVRAGESLLNNFFAVVNALVAESQANSSASDGRHHYEAAEKDILIKLEQAQTAFRAAMCDSFDTPTGMQVLLDLVSATNVYLARGRGNVNIGSVSMIADWVTRMLRMFGLGEGSPTDSRAKRLIGWGVPVAPGQSRAEDRNEVLMPFLRAMSAFRDGVRKLAMEGGSNADILALSDRFRDEDAVELGVALDDQADGRALFKLVPADILREARDAKVRAGEEKAAKKAASAAAAEAKKRERLEKGRLAPVDMFRTAEYSAWDEAGLPTLDKEGVELPKSRRKKLQKEWDAQDKLHKEYLKEVGSA